MFGLHPTKSVAPRKHDVTSMPTQQYYNTNHISIDTSHPVVSIILRYAYMYHIKWKSVLQRENRQQFVVTVIRSEMQLSSVMIATISRDSNKAYSIAKKKKHLGIDHTHFETSESQHTDYDLRLCRMTRVHVQPRRLVFCEEFYTFRANTCMKVRDSCKYFTGLNYMYVH